MSTYRDDREALAARVALAEEELTALTAAISETKAEHDALLERERGLEKELERPELPASERTRTDRVLETIVFTPIEAVFSGALGAVIASVLVGLPTFLFTKNPGNWLLYALGAFLLAGFTAGGVRSVRRIWKS